MPFTLLTKGRGLLSKKKKVVLHRCGVLQDNLDLSIELMMEIGHCKEFLS